MDTLQNSIKLRCIKTMAAHWGVIFQEGKEYDCTYVEKEVTIITDYKSYYDRVGVMAKSIEWVRKGYNEDTLHKVIPGYMTYKDVNINYTKKIEMPYLEIKTDDEMTKYKLFYIMTDEEIMKKFNLENKCLSLGKKRGHVTFNTSQDSVDEYFDYTSVRRENKLNNILCKKDQEK